MICRKCDGTGKLIESGWGKCPECDGKGYVTCPRCNGSGIE
jgi:DnaJ-class molecular chaperone